MRGADRGVDGVIKIIKDYRNGKDEILGNAIVQIKGGKVKRSDIATLKGDMEREGADAGVFITLEPPTREMKREAISTGDFKIDFLHTEYPKIQILTIQELLNGKKPDLPNYWQVRYHKEAEAEKDIDNNNQNHLNFER